MNFGMSLIRSIFIQPVIKSMGFWLAAMMLLLGLWQAIVSIFHVPAFVIPSPVATISAMFQNDVMIRGLLWQTFKETLAGYCVGAVVGVLLAVLMSQWPVLGRLLYPALVTSQAIPIVGIAAPLVIIFGFGMTPKLIIVAWIVFFPVVVNMMDGLAHIDRDQINLARLLGATPLRTFLYIRLPACLGPLFSGLKIGASYAVTGAVIGEWTASSKMGLGTYLLAANAQMNSVGVYGAMLLMTFIGIGSFAMLLLLEYLAMPWRHRATPPWWRASRL